MEEFLSRLDDLVTRGSGTGTERGSLAELALLRAPALLDDPFLGTVRGRE